MDQTKLPLSVALAVFNESANLADCLETIKDIASEIVIVDGQSSDNTVEIAKQYNATVLVEENRSNFHINKQHAIDACAHNWILQLDADERVSTMLASEISAIVSADPSTTADAY